jgi:hypothetical protein
MFIDLIVYNTLTLLMLLYSTENWTLKAKDKNKITAAEMEFMIWIMK